MGTIQAKQIQIRQICKCCGKGFYRYVEGMFCSKECQQTIQTTRKTLSCQYCGKLFSRAPNAIGKKNYCTARCRYDAILKTTREKYPKKTLVDLYEDQRKSFRQMNAILGINTRTIIKLFEFYGIETRKGSEAVVTQWEDNIERRERQAILFAYSTAKNRNPTKAEAKIIKYFKKLAIEFKFQYPVYKYILDFAIPDIKLAIEIDDKSHRALKEKKLKDAIRTKRLESLGWRLIRFSNEEVFNSFDDIKHRLSAR